MPVCSCSRWIIRTSLRRPCDVLIRVVRADPKVIVKPEYQRPWRTSGVSAGVHACARSAGGRLAFTSHGDRAEPSSRHPRARSNDEGVIHNVNTPDDIR